MIRRSRLLAAVDAGLRLSPVTAILGPRQCGKTTLAHEFARQHEATYFDLEDPEDQVKLTNPKLVLEGLRGLVILDEIQRKPELTLLIFARGKRWGFEFKYQDAPDMTKSLHLALEDLKPERVWIVYPGHNSYSVHDRVEVVPLSKALEHAQSLI